MSYYSMVDDSTLARAAGHPELEVLSICGTRITDEGLVVLSDLENLRELDLSDNEITDQGSSTLNRSSHWNESLYTTRK